jgi:acyl carrier protein phosphodiesterase
LWDHRSSRSFAAPTTFAVNYLAHLLLSAHSSDALLGALLGDFVKGQALHACAPGVRDGITLHRAIDRYTDRHALVLASRGRVSAARRRFAGVLVDIFYDHFLARHWDRFCDEPLDDFTANVYALLHTRRAELPERLARLAPHMSAEDWLGSYAERWAVDAALQGMARRLRRYPRAAVLADGVIELERDYALYEQDFLSFFPQLLAFSEDARAEAETALAASA